MANPDYYPSYAGIQTFMRAPLDPAPVGKTAIVGVPYDGCTSNRAGAREAPAAIRKMSMSFDADRDRQYPSGGLLFGEKAVSRYQGGGVYRHIVDADDVRVHPADPHGSIQSHLSGLIHDGNKLVVLGGDHSITLDSLRAHHAKYGKMGLLHFDAHPDTWDDTHPSHGTFVTTAVKEGLIEPFSSLLIGARTEAPDLSIPTIEGYSFNHAAALEAIQFVQDLGKPIYMTFDVDVLDPAYAPGTGTPVAGGLSTREVLRLIMDVPELRLCGMDVVEVCPAYDHSGITALAAATVIQHVLQKRGTI